MESMFKTVQRKNDGPLSERVAQQISSLIKEQNIGVGDKLPNEFELAESLNVGRGTIREAVKLLVARNCLEIRRGKGTYVTQELGKIEDPLGFDYVKDKLRLAKDLYEIRVQIEPWIAAMAAERIQDEEKEELLNRCAAVEETISAGSDHGASDVAFHQYIAKCTHNDVLPEIIPIITYGVDLFTRIREKEPIENTLQYHRVITEAICANDPEAARQGMLDHLKSNLWCINRLETMGLQPDTGNR